MKNTLLFRLAFFLICFTHISCKKEAATTSVPDSVEVGTNIDTDSMSVDAREASSDREIQQTTVLIKNSDSKSEKFEKYITQLSIINSDFQPKEVNLQEKLIEIFSPDKFLCGFDPKFAKKIKDYKSDKSNLKGYVPDVIRTQITDTKAYEIDAGLNTLLHGFYYIKTDGTASKVYEAESKPTSENFSFDNFLIKKESNLPYYFYTLDCQGYLSSLLNVGIDVNIAQAKTSAEGAAQKNTSLFILYGVVKSPLYFAYEGTDIFAGTDKKIIDARREILNSILIEIKNQSEVKKIILHQNYLILCSSNTGTSSFNGEVKVDASSRSNFGVGTASGSTSAGGKVTRSTEFAAYKTYTIQEDVRKDPAEITIKQLKDKIASLK